ncbi:MSP domain protein [Ancylostoma ceylanicum]|uniref:MSP domain protein n=1 Tax=Ancylostoma ceylanicum TaxID=53326 RepID=A0A0D6MBH7_9BILA|nr:MSP domain protein [Ancylostoma ceylanicum]
MLSWGRSTFKICSPRGWLPPEVKCTDNDIFRVRPPLSFVKADETAVVKIVLTAKTPPENNRHFFAVYHMKCNDDTGKTARQQHTMWSSTQTQLWDLIGVRYEDHELPVKKEAVLQEKNLKTYLASNFYE